MNYLEMPIDEILKDCADYKGAPPKEFAIERILVDCCREVLDDCTLCPVLDECEELLARLPYAWEANLDQFRQDLAGLREKALEKLGRGTAHDHQAQPISGSEGADPSATGHL